jgi:epoxyqueuosine reductase
MEPLALAELIARTADALGFDLVGIAPAGPSPDFARFEQWLAAGYDGEMAYLARQAEARADPRALLPEARSVIVLGASYFTHELPAGLRNDPSRGLIASYAWGQDYHDVLKPRLFELDAAIRAASGRTTLGRAFVDSGPVLERSWAQEAGLGFVGKNTCLITPGLGSWTFLAVLLVPEEVSSVTFQVSGVRFQGSSVMFQVSGATSQVTSDGLQIAGSAPRSPLPARLSSEPASQGPRSACTCGACTRCLEVCPTGAFAGPHVLDARRCISYLTIELRGPIPNELRPLLGNWVFGCDLCQMICPYNRRFARPGRLAALQARPETVAPTLLDLLALDEARFRRRFHGSPVLRAKRRGLLRNVCVALGNWGAPDALPGLMEALHDEEALVRGHAAWALGQIATPEARKALQTAAEMELDGYVRDEIGRAKAWLGQETGHSEDTGVARSGDRPQR